MWHRTSRAATRVRQQEGPQHIRIGPPTTPILWRKRWIQCVCECFCFAVWFVRVHMCVVRPDLKSVTSIIPKKSKGFFVYLSWAHKYICEYIYACLCRSTCRVPLQMLSIFPCIVQVCECVDAHFCLTASSFCVPLPLCVLPVCPAHLARSDRPRNKSWERSKIIAQHERSSAMWYKCTKTLIADTYSESFPEEK